MNEGERQLGIHKGLHNAKGFRKEQQQRYKVSQPSQGKDRLEGVGVGVSLENVQSTPKKKTEKRQSGVREDSSGGKGWGLILTASENFSSRVL